jgi:hypothetical protein
MTDEKYRPLFGLQAFLLLAEIGYDLQVLFKS